jgi:hypothetical protein
MSFPEHLRGGRIFLITGSGKNHCTKWLKSLYILVYHEGYQGNIILLTWKFYISTNIGHILVCSKMNTITHAKIYYRCWPDHVDCWHICGYWLGHIVIVFPLVVRNESNGQLVLRMNMNECFLFWECYTLCTQFFQDKLQLPLISVYYEWMFVASILCCEF